MTVIQPRRGTAAQWTTANPVLAMGEVGYETDTGREKRGNGTSQWSALPYLLPPAPLAVSRKESGGSYPDRVEGVTNIFIGPTDPGLDMDPNEDLWANPNLTTLDTVASSASTTGTPLNQAIKTVAGANTVWVSASDLRFLDTGVTFGLLTSSPHPAIFLPSGVGRTVRTIVHLPAGWTTAWCDIYWTHEAASHAANVRWVAAIFEMTVGSALPPTYTNQIGYTSSVNEVNAGQLTATTPVSGLAVNSAGGPIGLTVTRLGSSTSDTFASTVALLGIRLRKAS